MHPASERALHLCVAKLASWQVAIVHGDPSEGCRRVTYDDFAPRAVAYAARGRCHTHRLPWRRELIKGFRHLMPAEYAFDGSSNPRSPDEGLLCHGPKFDTFGSV